MKPFRLYHFFFAATVSPRRVLVVSQEALGEPVFVAAEVDEALVGVKRCELDVEIVRLQRDLARRGGAAVDELARERTFAALKREDVAGEDGEGRFCDGLIEGDEQLAVDDRRPQHEELERALEGVH